jgi:hypothetical protein
LGIAENHRPIFFKQPKQFILFNMVTVIKRGAPKAEIAKRMKAAMANIPKKDILAFAGKLKGNTDPLVYQLAIRNEWE